MVFTIEPMINLGKKELVVLDDGWTAVTRDRRLSAHFEFAVAVTECGPWILSEPYPYAAVEAEAAARQVAPLAQSPAAWVVLQWEPVREARWDAIWVNRSHASLQRIERTGRERASPARNRLRMVAQRRLRYR